MRILYSFTLFLVCCSPILIPSQTNAQTGEYVSAQLGKRTDEALNLLQGKTIEAGIFDENFRNAVPPDQLRALRQKISEQQGQALDIVSITSRGANSAIVKIRFEKSIGTMHLDLETAPPHRISGLLITGFEAAGDTIKDVVAAIDALPGRQGLIIQQLDGTGSRSPQVALDPDGRYAIASTFKLYILAEIDRAVQAGERQWSDVVRLGPKSHPTGISQNWPDASPVTLHTLATLMISISDNSATDTLIRVIGQQQLARIVKAAGHHNPDELRPFLMTRQVSVLKMPALRAQRERFLEANPADRQNLLTQFDNILSLDSLDSRILTNRPNWIDQLEWFATPQDIIKLLDHLHRNASEETRAILAINPGIGQDSARKWNYFGYKGGSEPGVLSYGFLLQSRAGHHYAISIIWNNSEQSLQESDLLALTTRLVNLLAEQ
ncbi:serine hydrolase [Parasphingorhabdus sp.]|uniref:serine hydrolase n=1 Tax=Parasphingorhabdus sp. TaxID=2709688 RepID=UPI003A90A6FA